MKRPTLVPALLATLLALEAALLLLGPSAAPHQAAIREALAAGRRPDWWDDAVIGVRLAAGIGAALLALLLATFRLWTRPFSEELLLRSPERPATPRWFWPAIAGVVLIGLGLRLPLASKSLWWDEAWVLQQASHGKWIPDKKHPGEQRFLAHDWARCAWYYQKPTNHAPMSLMQKASLSTWRAATHAERREFNDLVARAPALLASAIAFILIGCLLRDWGRPGAGIGAAFLLAIHPWHLRYGVDARAYALVVPLCAGALLAATRILACHGTRVLPWCAWGLVEFLWLWAFPNALIDVAALNLTLGGFLALQPGIARPDRVTALLRQGATNVFAAIAFLHAFLPNLMQARRWAGQESDGHFLDAKIAGSTLTQILTGRLDGANGQLPIAGAVVLAGIALLLVVRRKDSKAEPRLLLLTLFASTLVFALLTAALHIYFYPRFVIAILPAAIAGACFVPSSPFRQAIAWLIVALWLPLIAQPLSNAVTRPIAPLRDVAEYVGEFAVGSEKPPLLSCYGLGNEALPIYAPACEPIANRADLERLMQKARAEQRVLFVTCGYVGFNRVMHPDGFALLDDSSRFQEMKSFTGLEPDFTFRVLRMKQIEAK